MSDKYIKIFIIIIPLVLLLLCMYKYNINSKLSHLTKQYYNPNYNPIAMQDDSKKLNNKNNIDNNDNMDSNDDPEENNENKSNIGGYNIYHKETFMSLGKIFGKDTTETKVVPSDPYQKPSNYIGETPPFADLDFNTSNAPIENTNKLTDAKDKKDMDISQMLTIAKDLKSKINEKSKPYQEDNPDIYEKNAIIPQNNINTRPIIVPLDETPKYTIENSCRFFSDEKCPSDYPIFSGASLALSGDPSVSINCNGNSKTMIAKAVASIDNGTLSEVILINSGKGYKKIPKIKVIRGNSSDYTDDDDNAQLQAELNDDGEIAYINIINKGNGYKRTPKIVIDPPDGNNACHMCCKKQ